MTQHLEKVLLSLTYFRKIIFLYIQEKECATFLIAPTIESYLGTLQKHQELASSGYPYFFFLIYYYYYYFFFWCFRVFRLFLHIWLRHIRFLNNGPKTIHTENLYPSVTSVEKLKSIWCQMRSQACLISERGQKILYWKLGQSCCFIFFFYFYFYSIFFIAIQWILPTTGVVHTSIIPQYFFIIIFGVFRRFWHIWWRHQ